MQDTKSDPLPTISNSSEKQKRNPMTYSLKKKYCSSILVAAVFLPCLSFGAEGTTEATVDYALDEVASSLVQISYRINGKKVSGNGVIVQMDSKTYLLTNQHILLGAEKISFITLSGERLAPRSVELSVSRDLARLALEKGPGLSLSPLAGMNTPVALFTGGNGEKQKVEHGKIIGVGGGKIEISASFGDAGNGAPALNANKEVVGIATYSQKSSKSAMKLGTRFEEAERHFCCRIGKNDWKKVNWKTYNKKYGKAFQKHKAFYTEIIAIFKDKKSFNASAKRANELATQCRIHARQLRMLTKQRDLTDFLLNEFEDQAELFEYAEDLFLKYSKSRL